MHIGRFSGVADWSQAEIGYTARSLAPCNLWVADWSQAEIGYTYNHEVAVIFHVADWSQAEIGYTCRELSSVHSVLRIGHRLRLVTLDADLVGMYDVVADWSQAEIGYT